MLIQIIRKPFSSALPSQPLKRDPVNLAARLDAKHFFLKGQTIAQIFWDDFISEICTGQRTVSVHTQAPHNPGNFNWGIFSVLGLTLAALVLVVRMGFSLTCIYKYLCTRAPTTHEGVNLWKFKLFGIVVGSGSCRFFS